MLQALLTLCSGVGSCSAACVSSSTLAEKATASGYEILYCEPFMYDFWARSMEACGTFPSMLFN